MAHSDVSLVVKYAAHRGSPLFEHAVHTMHQKGYTLDTDDAQKLAFLDALLGMLVVFENTAPLGPTGGSALLVTFVQIVQGAQVTLPAA